MSRVEAAGYLGVSRQTLEKWACLGRPELRYIMVGGLCKYRISDLEAFLNSRTATSAAGHAALAAA